MKSFHLAGAAALCAALLFTGCAKKTSDQATSGSSTTDTTTQAGATPAADAAATTAPTAPVVTATAAAGDTSVSSSSGNGASTGFIDVPVYPGATSGKDEGMAVSGNGGSVAMKFYATKDDPKRVADWYKAHLPPSWQSSIISAGGTTMGTFVDEHKDGSGDQTVIVAKQDDGTTRIQIATKHGK
jgi:hypothetical protein